MAKVEAPNKAYNGPGPGGALFEDGVAQVDDEAALNYYRDAGYKVSGQVQSPVEEQPEPPDPRDITEDTVGTRLRDAAVDPEPEDFLAPINAGEGNPHGSAVVSPEIHASGPAGLRPGVTFVEDIEKQEAREKAYAEARLIDGVPASQAVRDEIGDLHQRGELGLSDPGSAALGAEGAKTQESADPATPVVDAGGDAEAGTEEAATAGEPPAKSAPKQAWVDYAVAQGASTEEAEAATKADLIEQYAG